MSITRRIWTLIISLLLLMAFASAISLPVYADDGNTAQIGEVQYQSLAEAVEAANDSDTILMIADEDLSGPVTINKTLTLDLNNHTVSRITESGSGTALIVDGSGITVTIIDSSGSKEGTVIGSVANSLGKGVDVKQGTLVVESGNIGANTGSTTFVSILT